MCHPFSWQAPGSPAAVPKGRAGRRSGSGGRPSAAAPHGAQLLCGYCTTERRRVQRISGDNVQGRGFRRALTRIMRQAIVFFSQPLYNM
mgnify:CR=1 FL=1